MRKLLGWLKRLLYRKPDPWLDCNIVIGDRVEFIRYKISGSIGLKLCGMTFDLHHPGGSRLIDPLEARDRRHWWKLWRWYNNRAKLTWNDGTTADIGISPRYPPRRP